MRQWSVTGASAVRQWCVSGASVGEARELNLAYILPTPRLDLTCSRSCSASAGRWWKVAGRTLPCAVAYSLSPRWRRTWTHAGTAWTPKVQPGRSAAVTAVRVRVRVRGRVGVRVKVRERVWVWVWVRAVAACGALWPRPPTGSATAPPCAARATPGLPPAAGSRTWRRGGRLQPWCGRLQP